MISEFKGDYRFLSNFYAASVYLDGILYPSVEHAFQAAKTEKRQWREKILLASSPGIAKSWAKSFPEKILIPIGTRSGWRLWPTC